MPKAAAKDRAKAGKEKTCEWFRAYSGLLVFFFLVFSRDKPGSNRPKLNCSLPRTHRSFFFDPRDVHGKKGQDGGGAGQAERPSNYW